MAGTKYDSHPKNPDMSFQEGIKVSSNPTTFRMGLEPSTTTVGTGLDS